MSAMPLTQWLKLTHRQVICALLLAPVFAGVYYFAFWLRYDADWTAKVFGTATHTVPLMVAVHLAVFAWYRCFQGWSRYVTFYDLTSLGKAASVSAVLTVLGVFLFFPSIQIPRSIPLLVWGMTIFIVGAMRGGLRLVMERGLTTMSTRNRIPVLIVGINEPGETLLRSIRRNRHSCYKVVGFISADNRAVGHYIDGVCILGTLDQIYVIAQHHAVREILITAGELGGSKIRELFEACRGTNIAVKVFPSFEQVVQGHVRLQPRDVSIEDLLQRESVQLDLDELRRWIDGRVILVTGSAGSIGSEICRQLVRFSPRKLILLDLSENGQFFLHRELQEIASKVDFEVCIGDITDGLRMSRLFKEHQPQLVFHAASYKHVPLMETNPSEALKTITLGSRTLADLACRHGVESFVMISTDKAVNPTSVMGTCKRIAEMYIQAISAQWACRFITVRFGNVLDSTGSVVPIFRQQIARGGPITITHPEMRRYFMTIPEASQLVLQAGAMGNGGEIFVLDMGEPIRILDLAQDMIRLSGFEYNEDIAIEFIGIRPGEKLNEQLHLDSERHLPTAHSKITVAESSPADMASIREQLSVLEHYTTRPNAEIIEQLKRFVLQDFDDRPGTSEGVLRAA